MQRGEATLQARRTDQGKKNICTLKGKRKSEAEEAGWGLVGCRNLFCVFVFDDDPTRKVHWDSNHDGDASDGCGASAHVAVCLQIVHTGRYTTTLRRGQASAMFLCHRRGDASMFLE